MELLATSVTYITLSQETQNRGMMTRTATFHPQKDKSLSHRMIRKNLQDPNMHKSC